MAVPSRRPTTSTSLRDEPALLTEEVSSALVSLTERLDRLDAAADLRGAQAVAASRSATY